MTTKYKQRDGYDVYHNKDDEGRTINKGRATYNEDGTLKRLDNYSPSSKSGSKHHHEWCKEKDDGSYKYDHGEHDNH